jgi:hypothetical protein
VRFWPDLWDALDTVGVLTDQELHALIDRAGDDPLACAAVVESCSKGRRRLFDFISAEWLASEWCREDAYPDDVPEDDLADHYELVAHLWAGVAVTHAPMSWEDRLLLVRLIADRCGDRDVVAWRLCDGPLSTIGGEEGGLAFLEAAAARQPWLHAVLDAGDEP